MPAGLHLCPSVKLGIEASLTGLYPYGRCETSERVSVWGVAGYGEGRLTVEPESQVPLKTDMDLAMDSVGVHGVIIKARGRRSP